MGRHLKFDPDTALAGIKAVFWRQGYEGTSLQDIEAATRLNKQSLYRLFGGKRQMYLRALQDYDAREMQAAVDLMRTAGGSAAARVRRLLNAIIDEVERTGDRRGCFLCNSTVDQAQLDDATRKTIAGMVERYRAAFAEALAADERYQKATRRREKAALTLLSGYFGLRVLVKSDASIAALRDAADGIVSAIGT